MRRWDHGYAAFRRDHALQRMGKPPRPPEGRSVRKPAPPGIQRVAKAELDAASGGALAKHTATDLIAALDEAEHEGFIGHFVVGVMWRAIRAVPAAGDAQGQAALQQLMHRLHRHARLANALIKAKAEVKPIAISPHAWASKAGPKREVRLREEKTRKDLLAAARKHYVTCDAAPWTTEGGITIRFAPAPPELSVLRAGGKVAFLNELTVSRLDLVDLRKLEGATLASVGGLSLTLREGQLLSVWHLADRMDAAAKRTVRAIVDSAILGIEDAAKMLEDKLPLAHAEIARALRERPDAKGAERLRMLLHQFTD